MDSQWHTNQRDCAGLVRFAYRSAFRKLRPNALPLWKDRTGIRRPFADAETLLGYNFESLGRSEGARIQLRSGDLVAFRQLTADGPAFHLMLIVQSEDPAHAAPRVVYHPGQKDADVRVGTLAALMHEAPHEWRPIETNAAFLGYFRLKEWMHE